MSPVILDNLSVKMLYLNTLKIPNEVKSQNNYFEFPFYLTL